METATTPASHSPPSGSWNSRTRPCPPTTCTVSPDSAKPVPAATSRLGMCTFLSVIWKDGLHHCSSIYSNVATEGRETSSPAALQKPPPCPHQFLLSPGMRIVSFVVRCCDNEMRLTQWCYIDLYRRNVESKFGLCDASSMLTAEFEKFNMKLQLLIICIFFKYLLLLTISFSPFIFSITALMLKDEGTSCSNFPSSVLFSFLEK